MIGWCCTCWGWKLLLSFKQKSCSWIQTNLFLMHQTMKWPQGLIIRIFCCILFTIYWWWPGPRVLNLSVGAYWLSCFGDPSTSQFDWFQQAIGFAGRIKPSWRLKLTPTGMIAAMTINIFIALIIIIVMSAIHWWLYAFMNILMVLWEQSSTIMSSSKGCF